MIITVNKIGTSATKAQFCDMEEKVNKQKQQSIEWLTNALLALMKEKDYRDISVTEICERADLSRRTFYRLYESKEDVFKEYAGKLCMCYFELFKNQDDISLTSVADIFFSFWKAHKDFLLMLHKHNLIYIVLFKFNELLPTVYVKYKAHMLQTKDTKSIEYVAFYNAGGFWNLLIKWLEDDCAKTPGEMAAIVNEIMNLL